MMRRTPLARTSELQPGTPPQRRAPLRTVPLRTSVLEAAEGAVRERIKPPRRETGFSPKVKLSVRTRAGNGDPDEARCEATGVWLGRYGGEIQHRACRGMGGTSDPAKNSIVNAVLLSTEAHRVAESRDERMNAGGFWLRNGQDPALTPIWLSSEHRSGIAVWLSPDGGYAFEAPAVAS